MSLVERKLIIIMNEMKSKLGQNISHAFRSGGKICEDTYSLQVLIIKLIVEKTECLYQIQPCFLYDPLPVPARIYE